MSIFFHSAADLQRMSMTRVDDPSREFIAMFNPTQAEEELTANYARQAPPGLPHQVLQYTGTTNLTINITLFFNAEFTGQIEEVAEGRRFLHSVFYPRNAASTQQGMAPPRVLFLWPGDVFSLICKVVTLQGVLERFNAAGQLLQYTAVVGLEEDRDESLNADNVFEQGTVRGRIGR